MIKVLKEIKKQEKWWTDGEGFTLTKLFKYNKETKLFVHQADVELFIEGVLGHMMKQKYSPYLIAGQTLKHTMWMLPRDSDAIVALKSVIEKILKK